LAASLLITQYNQMSDFTEELKEIYEEGEKPFLIKLSHTQKAYLRKFRDLHSDAYPGQKRLSLSDAIAIHVDLAARTTMEPTMLLYKIIANQNEQKANS
jgi:hypothetical protein